MTTQYGLQADGTFKSKLDDPVYQAQIAANKAARQQQLLSDPNSSASKSAALAQQTQSNPVYQQALSSGATPSQASIAVQQSKPAQVSTNNAMAFHQQAAQASAAAGNTNPYTVSTPGVTNQQFTVGSGGSVLDASGRPLSSVDRDRLGRTLGWVEHKTYDANGNVIATNMVPNVAGAKINTDPNQGQGSYNLGTGQPGGSTMRSGMWQTTTPPATTGQDLQFGGDLERVMNEMFPEYSTRGAQTTDLGNQTLYAGQGKVQDMTPPLPAGSSFTQTARQSTETGYTASPFEGVNTEAGVRAGVEYDFYKQAEEDAKRALDEMTEKYKGETDSMLKSWDESANQRYSDKLAQADQATKDATEELMRFAGAKGSSRSSRTMEAGQKIQEKNNQTKQALLEERDRERQLYEAQLRGVEGEALAHYANALQQAQVKRSAAEGVLVAAKQGLLLEQQALAAEQENARKSEYVNYLKSVGLALDPITGQTVESLEGQIDKAKVAKDLASAQKTQAEATKLQKAIDNNWEVKSVTDANGNQIYQWIDPQQPGVIQSFESGIQTGKAASSGGGGGGSYSGGGSGGSGGSGAEVDGMVKELAYSDLPMQEVLDYIKTLPFGTTEKQNIAYSVEEERAQNQANRATMPASLSATFTAGTGLYSSDPSYLQ